MPKIDRNKKVALLLFFISMAFIFFMSGRSSDYRRNREIETLIETLSTAIYSTGIPTISYMNVDSQSLMKYKYFMIRYKYDCTNYKKQQVVEDVKNRLKYSNIKIYVNHDFDDYYLIQAYNNNFFFDILIYEDMLDITVNKK